MTCIIRHLILLAGTTLLASVGFGQDEPKKPFAQYAHPTAQYLNRLHLSRAQPALAFRENYPGGFAAWQKAARVELRSLLGLNQIREDAQRHHPTVKLDSVIKEDGYTRQRGEIETEPGVAIPFWLLRPEGEPGKRRPLALCAHGHDTDGWNTYAGVYRDDAHRRKTLSKDGDVGVQAVRHGFVALVPATRGLAAATQIPDLKGRHGNRPCRTQLIHCLIAGRTAVGERVWDTQRLLDWAVADLRGIDPQQIVMLGNSGGGVLTVYTAALDERIAVSVPSCSFTSYTSDTGFIFHCDCCLIPRVAVRVGDMADVGALAAPRPLLAVHGRKDGLHNYEDVERAMARVRSIYAAATAANRFQHRWGNEGHKFYPEIMWPFIESALMP